MFKTITIVLILLGIYSCGESIKPAIKTSENAAKNEIAPKIQHTELKEIVEEKKTVSIDTFNISHYYEMLLEKEFGKLTAMKDDSEAARDNNTMWLLSLDYNAGFLNFRTCNTPADMDGDSETEYQHLMTYWILENESRLIAHTENLNTWVSDEHVATEFFVHDQNGIRDTIVDGFNWNLADFVKAVGNEEYSETKDLSLFFDKKFFNNPTVYVQLPSKGAEIEVTLSLFEYMDDVKGFELFTSMNIEQNKLIFNPKKDLAVRKK